jgi:hypothetical protein
MMEDHRNVPLHAYAAGGNPAAEISKNPRQARGNWEQD